MTAQIVLILILAILFISSALKVVREYDRGVIFRLGRILGAKGPGLIFLIPLIDKMVKVSLRVITMDIPTQDIITKDNVSVKVNAVLYFRVVDPVKAIVNVEDYLFATGQLAQTTLRSILGQVELDDLLSKRESINEQLQTIVDDQTDPWGVKVSLVELKHVDLPSEMQRAMAKQAEAERDRRAKIIHAEGEYQASEKLAKAAEILGTQPAALQLRYLQTLTEVAAENNSTLIFPLPIEFLKAFSHFTDTPSDTKKES
ncbi:MAG: slipin family protein [Candidatus Marinimicrobia bacterium]|nr:slipin family protein [Candidatus Neomarinimicrobiota bacterium]